MRQEAKFIDVTRSYIPIDPNSFPKGLHIATREDLPENRVPVSAYKGYNFLPTSYGYKSYFGINSKLDIDSLNARVDRIFTFQNDILENVLIALCDTGIWIKKGEASGAWTQALVIAPDPDPNVYFPWSWCIINNDFYCYRQGAANYQKIISDSVTGVAVSSVVPNFLNMAGQVEIFRAGARLGFRDSDDSFAWSNLDDFADFTPSLETLAGNAKFTEIQGKVVTIKSHGPGFMVYATKSILYVQENVENVYRWKPRIVSSNSGISYPRQVTVGEPDTTHFVYASDGLKRIENAQAEVIVPEVTDFLKEYSKPTYLNFLNNRYLFLEILDDAYLTGNVQFNRVDVPPSDITFPAIELDIDAQNPPTDYQSQCFNLGLLNNGNFGGPSVPPSDWDGTSLFRPIWAAYLSRGGAVVPSDVTFGPGACNVTGPDGVPYSFTPDQRSIAALSGDDTGKTPVLGSSAYVDGNWTITRFIQTQLAWWKIQDDAREEFIDQVLNRARVASGVSYSAVNSAPPNSRSECAVGQFGTRFSSPMFGYSKCEFWLTRFALAAIDVTRVRADTNVAEDSFGPGAPEVLLGYDAEIGSPDGPYYPSIQAAFEAVGYGSATITSNGETGTLYGYLGTSSAIQRYNTGGIQTRLQGGIGRSARAVYQIQSPYVYANSSGFAIAANSAVNGPIHSIAVPRYKITQTMSAYNRGTEVPITPVQDTAICRIIGWKYTDTDGNPATVAVGGGGCVAPSAFPDTTSYQGGAAVNIDPIDGSYCSEPFEGAIIDSVTVNWPAQSVTIPGSDFLLQRGSPAPLYPEFAGALVYDTHLKKWGKMRVPYKQLLDYSPINSSENGNIPFDVFGIMAGMLNGVGDIYLFDEYPADSKITYGKIGFYRLGKTKTEEVHVDFRKPCTGYMKTEVSLDGTNISVGLEQQVNYTNANEASIYGIPSGSWINVELGGWFDISYLEYRAYRQGVR